MVPQPIFFSFFRKKIKQNIVLHIAKLKKELTTTGPLWLGGFFTELIQFAKKGRMIRGSLVLLGAQIAGGKINNKILSVAVAMEFVHSSFLIHDDIMDRDEMRRGFKTLHKRFEDYAQAQKINEPTHFGISSAICIGDLGFFLSYYFLEQGDGKSAKNMQAVRHLFSTEISKVALAQIIDVSEGMRSVSPSIQSVLNLYKHKTARYTFSLPLLLGALHAGASGRVIKQLSEFGENIGILFQIQDDYLGLFGDIKKTEKSIGSDIAEGKKTPYYILLMERTTRKEKSEIMHLQEKQTISHTELDFIKKLMKKHGVLEEVQKIKNTFKRKAEKNIDALIVSEQQKEQLRQLLFYIATRER